MKHSTRSGFTVVDLVGTLVALPLVFVAVAGMTGGLEFGQPVEKDAEKSKQPGAGEVKPVKGGPRKAMTSKQKTKDSQNLRGIQQGFALFAQNNQDSYPRPSVLDRANNTLKTDNPAQKDDTKNIVSTLIFSNFFGPEITISPGEVNKDFAPDDDYQYSEPEGVAGADRKLALWDPRFKGPPSAAYQGCRAGDKGNFSYAHTVPLGGRLRYWTNSFNATEAIVGARGGWFELEGAATGGWKPGAGEAKDCLPYAAAKGRKGSESITLVQHGDTMTWEGNICYNDNHSNYETRADPEGLPWTFPKLTPANQRTQFDNLFVNENDAKRTPDADSLEGDAVKNTNMYMRLYANMAAPKEGATVSLKGAWFAD